MTEETTLVFHKSKYFFPRLNRGFNLTEPNKDYQNGEGNYALVLCSSLPVGGAYSCIREEDGCLDRSVEGLEVLDISDEYINTTNGTQQYFNLEVTPINDWDSGFTINLASGTSDIQIHIGDEIQYLVGVFLIRRSNDFVISFAESNAPIPIKNFVTLPFDSKLLGVGYCSNQL